MNDRVSSDQPVKAGLASNEERAGRMMRNVRIGLALATSLWFLLLAPLFFEDVSPMGYVVLLVCSCALAAPGVAALVQLYGNEAARRGGIDRAATLGAAGAGLWILWLFLFVAVLLGDVVEVTGAHAAEIEWGRISGILASLIGAAGLNLLARRHAKRLRETEFPGAGNGARGFVTLGIMFGYFFCVLLCAAVLFPGTLRSPITANEGSAVNSLRSIHEAAQAYKNNYGNGYPSRLTVLGPPDQGAPPTCVHAGLIDSHLARAIKAGYYFEFSPGPVLQEPAAGCPAGVGSYEIFARPTGYERNGVRSFWMDHHGVIHQTGEDRAATRNDPEVRQ